MQTFHFRNKTFLSAFLSPHKNQSRVSRTFLSPWATLTLSPESSSSPLRPPNVPAQSGERDSERTFSLTNRVF